MPTHTPVRKTGLKVIDEQRGYAERPQPKACLDSYGKATRLPSSTHSSGVCCTDGSKTPARSRSNPFAKLYPVSIETPAPSPDGCAADRLRE